MAETAEADNMIWQRNGIGTRAGGVALALLLALAGCLAIQAATAESAAASGTVTVTVAGQGSATGPGIDCNQSGGPDCSESYADSSHQECDPERKPPCITVTDTPFIDVDAGPDGNGFVFQGWEGCDSTNQRTCFLDVTEDKSVTVRFADAQAPNVPGVSPGSGIQAGQVSLGASPTDNAGVARVEFYVRGALVATDTSAPFGTSFDSTSVADGAATLRATAFDAAGNSGSNQSQVTIDNHAPTLDVSSGPDGQTFALGTTQQWTFSASDTTLQSVQCSVVAEASAPSFGACSGSGTHSVTNLPNGTYTFTVRARDGLDRITDGARSFTIDGAAPQTSITGGPADGSSSTATSATFTFASSEGGSSFVCRVYPAALTPGAFGPCTGATSHTASGFSPGTYAFEVRATDAFGNVDATAAKRTFMVTAPQTGGNTGDTGGNTGGNAGTSTTSTSTTTTATTTTTTTREIVNATLSTDYAAFRKYTRYKRLLLKNVPAGAKVKVTCKGKKCPAKHSAKLSKFAKKKLRAGTKLTIRVTKPGAIGKQFVIKIRAGKRPTLKISQIV
jgi:hypothetical protein